MIPKAREIELEWQRIQQEPNDRMFASMVKRDISEEQLAFRAQGFVEGIKYCLEKFGRG